MVGYGGVGESGVWWVGYCGVGEIEVRRGR